MPRHAERELVLPHENHSGRLFPQQVSLFVAMGARHHLERWPQRARRIRDFARLKCVGYGDHEEPRAAEMRLRRNARIRRVAAHGRKPALTQVTDDIAILLHDDEGYLALPQCCADSLAHSAVSDEHDVPL